jgi:addiction module HigA family antidote
MTMKNPPYPGLTVKFDCLDELSLSVAQGAKVLGVTRQALNNLMSGKSGISPEMAFRLSKAVGSSPETWLGMQADYDLAEVLRRADAIKVERVARATLAQ